jgi:hypothetical protein
LHFYAILVVAMSQYLTIVIFVLLSPFAFAQKPPGTKAPPTSALGSAEKTHKLAANEATHRIGRANARNENSTRHLESAKTAERKGRESKGESKGGHGHGGGHGGGEGSSERDKYIEMAKEERRAARREERQARRFARAAIMAATTAAAAGNFKPNSVTQQQLQDIANKPNPSGVEADSMLAAFGIELEDELEIDDGVVGFEEYSPVTPEAEQAGDKENVNRESGESADGLRQLAGQDRAPSAFAPASGMEAAFSALSDAMLEKSTTEQRGSGFKTNIGQLKTGEGAGGKDYSFEEIGLDEIRRRLQERTENQSAVRRKMGMTEQSVNQQIQAPSKNIWDLISLRYQAVTEKNRLVIELKPTASENSETLRKMYQTGY